jgi:hypothetical protein
VYAGHAAVALFAKARRPALPMALLVPVAFGPDWVQWIFEAAGRHNRILSHSLISVVIVGTVVAASYRAARADRADAVALWLVYLSHWPADVITGSKPTWPGGPELGLMLYSRPLLDCALEIVVILVCWRAYRASLEPVARQRSLARAVPAGLIALQLGFTAIELIRPRATVATRGTPVHLDCGRARGDRNDRRQPPHGSCSARARLQPERARWRTTEGRAES